MRKLAPKQIALFFTERGSIIYQSLSSDSLLKYKQIYTSAASSVGGFIVARFSLFMGTNRMPNGATRHIITTNTTHCTQIIKVT